MENITLGQLATTLAFVVAFLGSLKYLKDAFAKSVTKTLEPLNESIRSLDISQCKNYLVCFLGKIEQGLDVDEVEIERAYEVYDHYEKDLNQNSYIHDKWNKLMNKK